VGQPGSPWCAPHWGEGEGARPSGRAAGPRASGCDLQRMHNRQTVLFSRCHAADLLGALLSGWGRGRGHGLGEGLQPYAPAVAICRHTKREGCHVDVNMLCRCACTAVACTGEGLQAHAPAVAICSYRKHTM
jgi:hypothetical protein